MSKKTSRSYLPEDPFTPTEGSNWGMNGFYSDLDYGAGTEDGAKLPSVQGLAGLPTDLLGAPTASADKIPEHVDVDMLGDISSLMETSVVDLSWLEVTEQDLSRLPKDTSATMVPELQEAWGRNRSKSSFALQAGNQDLETVRYAQTLKTPPVAQSTPPEDLRKVLERAIRRSAAGHSLQAILRQATAELGEDVVRITPGLKLLQEEHTLAGQVFIRAAAYPGCAQGRWTDQIRKQASGARYIIASERCGGCSYAEKGRCQLLKKTLVKSVPWGKARKVYGPKLAAEGRTPQGGGDPKEALQAAFESKVAREQTTTTLSAPKKTPRMISMQKARERLAAAETPQKTFDAKLARHLATRKKATVLFGKWVRNGLMERETALKLYASTASSEAIIRIGASLVAKAQTSVSQQYIGHGTQVSSLSHLSTEQRTKASSGKLEKALRQKAETRIRSLVAARLLPAKEANQLIGMSVGSKTLLKLAKRLQKKQQKTATCLPKRNAPPKYTGVGDREQEKEMSEAKAYENLKKASQAAVAPLKLEEPKLDVYSQLLATDSSKAAVDSSAVEFDLTNSPLEGIGFHAQAENIQRTITFDDEFHFGG